MTDISSESGWVLRLKGHLYEMAKRPGMYVGNNYSIESVFHFIHGYAAAIFEAGGGDIMGGFGDYIYAKHEVFDPAIHYISVISAAYGDRAIDRLPMIFDDFFEMKDRISVAGICAWRERVIYEKYGDVVGIPSGMNIRGDM